MSKAKRAATTQLTHDNWQDEEEAEEAGQFQVASEEQVKGRKIVTARRKLRPDSNSSPSTNGAFSSFAGFSKTSDTTAPTKTTSQFDFLSNMIKPKTNGEDKSKADLTTAVKQSEDSDEYLSKLEVLNKSVVKWITQHVEACPTCDLTPVFKDYEKHHAEIKKSSDAAVEKKSPKPAADTAKVEPLKAGFFGLSAPAAKPESKESFTFGSKSSESKSTFSGFGAKKADPVKESSTDSSDSNSVEKPPMFGFGDKPSTAFAPVFGKKSEAGEAAIKPFSFGADASSTAASGLFSSAAAKTTFGSAAASTTFGTGTFSFGSGGLSGLAAVKPTVAASADADEDDAPPVNEFTQVKEEDSLYSTKCKLYFKKDANFQEKGVGMLYIKTLEEGGTQLLVRADTNLGNILLNVRLASGMSAQKMQDKNVMLVCVPNPPINPKKPDDKPVPMLIKVKTADIADQLLKEIKAFTD